MNSSTKGLATANGMVFSISSMQDSLVLRLSFAVLGNLISRKIFQLPRGSGAI